VGGGPAQIQREVRKRQGSGDLVPSGSEQEADQHRRGTWPRVSGPGLCCWHRDHWQVEIGGTFPNWQSHGRVPAWATPSLGSPTPRPSQRRGGFE
jgi:hypothetical protein